MPERSGFSLDIGYISLSVLAGVAAYLAARAQLKQALGARSDGVDVAADERTRVVYTSGREWEVWMQEKGDREDGNQEE